MAPYRYSIRTRLLATRPIISAGHLLLAYYFYRPWLLLALEGLMGPSSMSQWNSYCWYPYGTRTYLFRIFSVPLPDIFRDNHRLLVTQLSSSHHRRSGTASLRLYEYSFARVWQREAEIHLHSILGTNNICGAIHESHHGGDQYEGQARAGATSWARTARLLRRCRWATAGRSRPAGLGEAGQGPLAPRSLLLSRAIGPRAGQAGVPTVGGRVAGGLHESRREREGIGRQGVSLL